MILLGTHDLNSPLRLLRGGRDVLKTIFTAVVDFWVARVDLGSSGYTRLARSVRFPPPQGIQINMMPFVMGNKSSLPQEYCHYWDMIDKCRYKLQQSPVTEEGKVCYLTIHESDVKEGCTQRRGGNFFLRVTSI